MIDHNKISDRELRARIRNRTIIFGGNRKLKIYGKLNCKSGKRMKKENRILFSSEKEAILEGYRPCGHCMKSDYLSWKLSLLQTNVFRF
ncbi:Ada metal-binding domain-containing protein [Leptospira sp. 'Mane']|uniref:Ada metal-binding domain-containing protein n=1 Tax=Leptospira sp. 'Mane' TaxID=3387407 RepID=UPI00398A6C15